MNQGLTKSEAIERATGDITSKTGMAALGGALSGGVFGGIGTGIGRFNAAQSEKEFGDILTKAADDSQNSGRTCL